MASMDKEKEEKKMGVSDVANNVVKMRNAGKLKSEEPKKVAIDDKPMKKEAAQKSDDDSFFNSEAFTQILLGTLPTIAGAALGGTQGAAIGAGASKEAVSKYEQVKQQEAAQRAAQAKADRLYNKEERKFALEEMKFGLQQQKFGAERKEAEKAFQLKAKEIAGKEFKDDTDAIEKLRKERNSLPTTRDTQQVNAAYERILAATESPSAAGDLALIFNYMKMLDPGSTVREGEFANAQNSGGVDDRVRAMYNRVARGERLSSTQRADFLSRASGLNQAQLAVQGRVDNFFAEQARKRGLNPDDIVFSFAGPDEQPKVPANTANKNNLLNKAAKTLKPEAQAGSQQSVIEKRRRLEELKRKAAGGR